MQFIFSGNPGGKQDHYHGLAIVRDMLKSATIEIFIKSVSYGAEAGLLYGD